MRPLSMVSTTSTATSATTVTSGNQSSSTDDTTTVSLRGLNVERASNEEFSGLRGK